MKESKGKHMSFNQSSRKALSISVFLIGISTLTIGISSLALSNSTHAASASGSVKLSAGVTAAISMSITGNADGTDCTNEGFDSCSTFGNLLPSQYATAFSLISVYTNSSDGYSLSVKADNHADLQTESGSSIPAGTLTSETGGQGAWSYKTDATGVKTNWTAMTTTDTTIKGTSIYSASDSNTTVTYGLSTSNNQAAGDYSTTLIYTATAPNDTEVYEPNPTANFSGDNVTFSAASVPIASGSTGTVTITPVEGYYLSSFTCTNGYTNNATTGSSATSAQTVTITNPNVAKSSTCIATMTEKTYMQSMTSSECTTTPQIVYDKRDESAYLVAELADGKCWMLDNLALDLTSSTVLNAMNQENTHASNTTLGYLKNGGGTASDQYAITGVVNWADSPTYVSGFSFSDPLVNMASKDVVPGDAPSGGQGSNKVGGYYNYCAASAGSYCYGNGTSSGTSSGDVTEDICPANWRMPTGGDSGEYRALYMAYNSEVANFRNALSTPLSGRFINGSVSYQGSGGYGVFWSATRRDNFYTYYLKVYLGSSNPANYDSRGNGFSVRCVLGS